MKMFRKKGAKRILVLLLIVITLAGLVIPAIAKRQWSGTIESFEQDSPVYEKTVEWGTTKKDLGLPESLRAVVLLDDEAETEKFVQAEPDTEVLEGCGYSYYTEVMPEESAEEPAEDASYEDEQQENGPACTLYTVNRGESDETVEPEYRRYGSFDGGENSWFASDEKGTIIGAVEDVPVTWSDDGYDEKQAGEYTFTAEIDGYAYAQEKPFAAITVGEAPPEEKASQEKDASSEKKDAGSKAAAKKNDKQAEDSKPETKQGKGGKAAIPAKFELKWTSPEDNYRKYDEDGVCQLTPEKNDYKLDTPGTSAQATINFSLGGDTSAQPGEVEIRLPQYIFETREGDPQGVIEMGVSNKKEGTTGFYYYIDESTQEIVITNYQEIEPSYIFTCDVVYHSTNGSNISADREYPSAIRDKYRKEFEADVVLTLGDQTPVSANTDSIAVQYNTDAKISGFSKATNSDISVKYETWQDIWGTKPADAEDYFYIGWTLIFTFRDNTQPFSLALTDTPDENGEIVGASTYRDFTNCAGRTTIPLLKQERPEDSNYNWFVLTRHPRSSLENGVTRFKNECEATLSGIDGASDNKSASSTYTYVDPTFKYPGDSFSISKGGPDLTGYVNKLEGAKEGESVSLGNYSVNSATRGWGQTLEEGADPTDYESYGKVPYTVEVTDDLMTLNDTTLSDGDYAFSSFYINLTEYDYVQDSTGTWKEAPSADYGSWEPVTIQYQIGTEGSWETLGTVSRINNSSTYQFEDSSGDIRNISSLQPVPFPAGTTGVRALHNTTYYKTAMGLTLQTQLYPTENVLSAIQNYDILNRDSAIYNIDTLWVFNQEGDWVNKQSRPSYVGSDYYVTAMNERDQRLYGTGIYGRHSFSGSKLTRASTVSSVRKGAKYTNDTEKGSVKAYYDADVYDNFQFNYGASWKPEEILNLNILKEQTQGTIYDLLPSGMSADAASVRVWTIRYGSNSSSYNLPSNNIYRCNTAVEFVENWRGSGRTMMIVKVTSPTGIDNIYSSTYNFYTGFHIEYDAYYPWDDVKDYGSSPRNSIAYKSGVGSMGGAYPDDGGTIVDKELMKDLDEDGNPEGALADTIYGETSTAFNLPFSAELSFSKRVKTAADSQYILDSTVTGGGEYSYRLRVASEENMTTQNIVLYDVLEAYDPDNMNRWKAPSLQSIDTSQPAGKDIDAVTYYSTRSGLDMSLDADRDLTDPSKWSASPPEDLADVTALAFDLRTDTQGNPYVLPPEQAVSVIVHMKAPTEDVKALEKTDACAYNTAWYTGTTTSQNNNVTHDHKLESQNTTVHIREPELELHKESDPESGTKNKPAEVKEGEELVYDVQVDNKEAAFSISDIQIEDTIPTGLTIDFDNIKWYSGSNPENAELVSDSSLVHVSRSGQTLTFTVDKLLGNESIHLLIPTTVDTNDNAAEYVNTAKITEISGAEHELKSETTYHQKGREVRGLTIKKTVPDLDPKDADNWFVFDAVIGDENTEPSSFSGTVYDKSDEKTDEKVTFKAGEKTKFQLKAGQYLVIKDIPRSTDYSVTEREDHLYETSIIVNGDEENKISGNSVSQTISNDNKILFHNKKNPSLPFTFTKINAEKTNKVLSGAEFSLYYLSCTDSDPGHTHDKPAETSDCWTLYKTAVSGSDGKVNLGDLSDGTYRLYETKVPDGFVNPAGGWELKVACGETEPLKITGMGTPKPPAFKVEDDGSMKLPNMPLLNPPMSGGKGIFPFIFGGVLLTGTAMLFLFIKGKRRKRGSKLRGGGVHW